MENKRLIIKYGLLLILWLTFSISILVNSKYNNIDELLNENLDYINKNHKLYNNHIKEFSEMFFFNHITKNQELLDLLKSDISNKKKHFRVGNILKDELKFLKKYKIREINFYSKNLEPIFKSAYEEYDNKISPWYKKLLEKSKHLKSGIQQISISSSLASIKCIRPIFDKEFNLIAIFEIAIDMPKFLHKIYLEKGFIVEFIVKKEFIKKELDKEFLDNYLPYKFNKNYLYEKSFYNNRESIDILDNSILKSINIKMKSNIEFSKRIKQNDKYLVRTYTPIIDDIIKDKIAYLVVTKKDKKLLKIEKRYNLYILICLFLSILIIILIYLVHIQRDKYRTTKAKLDGINKSIDKYVIAAETDLSGIVTYISQAFCNISGYKKEEIIGRPISIIRSPDISKKFFDNMWKKLKNGEVWEGELKNIDKNGNSYWVRGNILPIYNQKNEVISYRSIRVNISDEKQLSKMNSLLKRDLFLKLNEIKTRDKLKVDESKIKLMSQILDAFSNEWKKPISNISSKIIDFENRANEQKIDNNYIDEFAQVLNDEIKALSMQLNEFKKLFSNDNQNDKYNVYSVLKSAVSSTYTKGVEIVLNGDETIETFGVSYDLRKIIFGIINNSIDQFRIKKIGDGKIYINLSKSNDSILIKCEDNAGGIPDDVIPKIFDLDFSTKNVLSSNGLSLHLAKLILQKSNGDIWVKNQGKGCCFYIELISKDRRTNEREES